MAAGKTRPFSVPGSSILAAVLVTALAGVALFWGFSRNSDTAETGGMWVASAFASTPNGPMPARFDTGQQTRVSSTSADPGATFRVENGCATFAPQSQGRAAAYLTTPDMGRPVHSLGADITFTRQGSTPGAAALVVSDNYDSNAFPPILPPFPVHFVVTPVNWNVSVQKNTGSVLETIGAGSLSSPLRQDGSQSISVRLTIVGGQVTVDLSTGVHQVIKDPRISEWAGNFATFESFANFGQTDSAACFQKVWADSRGPG